MKIKNLLTLSGVALTCLSAAAIPAKLDLKTITQPDGTVIKVKTVGDEALHFTVTEDGLLLHQDSDGFYRLANINAEGNLESTGVTPEKRTLSTPVTNLTDVDVMAVRKLRSERRQAPQSGLGMYQKRYPTTGTQRIPVFLVEYQDVRFSEDYDVKAYFEDMVNGEDFTQFGGTGSIAKYYADQSGGKFTPQFDVYGPVTLPENQAYYGGNYGQGWDAKAHYMLSHAAKLLDSEVDFKNYDSDGDGDVDFVYIFYAGQGEHNQGDENTVWPHAGYIKQNADFCICDGKWLNAYACSSELEGDIPAGIGPFAHEFAHVIGLPDLYATDPMFSDRLVNPGMYTLLDYGCYNNDQRTPPNFTAYERNALKWNEPIMLNEPLSVDLQELSTGQFGLIPTTNVNEFWLLENRQLVGWDAYLPAHGLLIWQIDYNATAFSNNEVNNNPSHQRVDIIEANDIQDFLHNGDGFTYPGTTGNTEFTQTSVPAMMAWNGPTPDLPVTRIREKDGIVSFDIAGGNPGVVTGVESILDQQTAPVYYNLQGIRVMNPERGATLIEVRGSEVRKVQF